MGKTFERSGTYIVLFGVSVFFISCWLFLNLFAPSESVLFDYFTDTYGLVAALGAFYGFKAFARWGGFGSAMGKVVGFLSLGLLFQFMGQVSYAIYYYVFHIENAYPSIGDFFYFGSIPLYIFGILKLYKVLRVSKLTNTAPRKLFAVTVPAVFLIGSYVFFLRDYTFTQGMNIVAVFGVLLDFGYPLGAALFLGLTLIAYVFSRSVLGGKLKKDIMLLFVSLVMQYIADAVYLNSTLNETWRPGGFDDLFYLLSYAVMGFTLITAGKTAENIAKYAHDNVDSLNRSLNSESV